MRALLADARRGALIRKGARVVLYGPVNAGKSTLFNALAGAARALVDEEPGTTRDTLEARLELSGLAVTLVDTAGLREAAGRLEALGIGKTREALAGADVAVLVLPPGATAEQRAIWRSESDDARRVEVWGKADLQSAADPQLAVSGQTGAGLAALREVLTAKLGAGSASAVVASSARHLAGLEQVEASLRRAKDLIGVGGRDDDASPAPLLVAPAELRRPAGARARCGRPRADGCRSRLTRRRQPRRRFSRCRP